MIALIWTPGTLPINDIMSLSLNSMTPLLSSSSTVTARIPYRIVAPTFILLSILGFYTIAIHMYASHAPDRFLEIHKASKVPLTLTNNRIPLIDTIFIPLISFFVAAFGDRTSDAYSTTVNFVWSFSAAIQLPLIEAQRVRTSAGTHISWGTRLLTYPIVWGILYQRLSGGWILPLWLLAFLYAHPDLQGELTAVDGESVFVGWWAGHTIPALIMLVPGAPPLSRAPAWIAFPVWMVLGQKGYAFVRSRWLKRTHEGSGYALVQLTYASSLLSSFASHVHLVLIPALTATPSPAPLRAKLLPFLAYLQDFFWPASGLAIPSVAVTTASSGVRHFVQWDTIVVFLAVFIGVVWDMQARGIHAEWKMVAWMSALSFTVSPGAMTAGLMMYREREIYLNREGAMKRTV